MNFKWEAPLETRGENKTRGLLFGRLILFPKYINVSTGTACVSCETELSSGYPCPDPDHLLEIPCCVTCGGE